MHNECIEDVVDVLKMLKEEESEYFGYRFLSLLHAYGKRRHVFMC